MAGIVTISLELELGWGMHDMGVYDHLSADGLAEAASLDRLLKKCTSNDIQISFDVVGHLLHESCVGSHSGPYPDGWWDEDPGSDSDTKPLFYAPDIVATIRDNPIDHEICTHTYSHILADNSSPELIEHELSLVKEVHSEFGLPSPRSIVMPRHHEVPYDILHRYGIETIRRPVTDYGSQISNPIKLFFWILTREHPVCNLHLQNGVVETTCTPHPSLAGTFLPAGQRNPSPAFSVFPKRLRRRRQYSYLKNAIDLAAEQDEHVHLWSHLYNIANDQQLAPFEHALDYLAERAKEGKVVIKRMCDLPPVIT